MDFDRSLCLEVDKQKAFSFVFSGSDRAIILGWVAETSISNIVWLRLLTIKWRWPPVKCITYFTDKEI